MKKKWKKMKKKLQKNEKKSTEKSQQEHRMKGKEYWQPKSIVRSPFCLFIRLATMQQPQRPSFRDLGVMRLHVNAGYYPPLSGLLSTTTSTNRHAPKYQENFVVPPVPPENLVTTLKSKATSHLPLQWFVAARWILRNWHSTKFAV